MNKGQEWMNQIKTSTVDIGIDLSNPEPLSPMIFGFNLEHTRAAVSGGLSAQMLRNRKFAGKSSKNEGVSMEWFPVNGEQALFITNEQYFSFSVPYVHHHHENRMFRKNECQTQAVQNLTGNPAGIGQGGLFVRAGERYDFRIVARTSAPVRFNVSLTSRKGEKVYAETAYDFSATEWETVSFSLIPSESDPETELRVVFTGKARVFFGAVSMLPAETFHGMRKDVVEALKSLSPALLRWPGGNFAGEYRWMDGLLPVDERAPLQSYTEIETQPYTNGYDFHEINTDDFIALCRYVGAEPFLTINLAWEEPEKSAAWVEYCNGDENTEYGKLRIERGFKAPYNVKFWSLGNEMGYGHMEGPNTPEKYAALAETHIDAMLLVTPDLKLFSSGPYPNEAWAEGSAKVLKEHAEYVSLHNYSYSDIDYTSEEKIKETVQEILKAPEKNREILHRTRALLGDGLHISFDEWNYWYAWYRPSCPAEGLFAAKMLHMFLGESNPMDMPVVCYFQPVGEGAIEITPDTCRLMAIGQAIRFLSCHKGANLVKTSKGQDACFTATEKDGLVTLTLVNEDLENDTVYRVRISGSPEKASALVPESLLPHSYFEERPVEFTAEETVTTFALPPHSIGKIVFRV